MNAEIVPLLDTFLRHVQRQMDFPVLRALRRHHAKLHRVQRVPRVAARNVCQKFQRILLDHSVVCLHAPLAVHRPPDQLLYVLLGQRL